MVNAGRIHQSLNVSSNMSKFRLLLQLGECVEPFLTKWVQRMYDAGYLKDTTAKREDCIMSFWGFLQPVLDYLESNETYPSFEELLENKDNWAEKLIDFARRHRSRGISVDMFVGCLKTLVHSLDELVLDMAGTPEEKLDALNMIRIWSDGAQTLILADWRTMGQLEAVDRLAEANRDLTLEKNKYQNILEATSDAVLVTDPAGLIFEANTEAKIILRNRDILDKSFGEILALGNCSIELLLEKFPVNESHEIKLNDGNSVYNFRIIPLQTVSLASRGYMIILSDISLLVEQRESLQQEVSERTSALADSEKQYISLFQNAGESILLVDDTFKIIEANQRSTKVFGLNHDQLVDLNFSEFCLGKTKNELIQAVKELEKSQSWEAEITGKQISGRAFPMSVTINRVELETGAIIQILAKDITRQKELEQKLNHEKNQLQEVNITLRNVLESINDKNSEFQREVSQTVQQTLLPVLDKVEREAGNDIVNGYLHLVKDQLQKLAVSGENEGSYHLLKLSPAEIKVCQFIQSGSATKDIAETLGLSVDTIQTHRKNIRKKLGLRGRDVSLFNYLNASTKTYPTETGLS